MANPIFLSENMPAPTLPMTNSGPEVEQAHARICASSSENTPSALKAETRLAPTGYPERMLMKKQKPPSPPVPKSTFAKGEKTRETRCAPPLARSSAVTTRKGNTAGKTFSAQSAMPSKQTGT